MKIINLIMSYLNLIKIEFLCSIKRMKSYFFTYITSLLGYFFLFVVIYSFAKELMNFSEDIKRIYEFMWIISFLSLTFLNLSRSVATEISMGTFEQIMISPFNKLFIIISQGFLEMIMDITFMLILIFFFNTFMNIKIKLTKDIILYIILILFGMLGLGEIFAGLTILYKKIGGLMDLFEIFFILLGTFPAAQIKNLPSYLLFLIKLIPQGYISFGISNNFKFSFDLMILSVLYNIIGILSFYFCTAYAKKKGLMGKY